MENLPATGPPHSTPADPRGRLLGFWALIGTQFQGAFSDNALKWLVSFLVLESGVSREQRDFLFVLVQRISSRLAASPFSLSRNTPC